MKKTHLVAVLLAATFMIGSVPVQAAQEGRVKKSATAAKKQFRASIDRFKRCMRGKCTRWEALKVARDVGIAAAAVIAAMYVTGGALKKVGGPIVPELYFVGEALQAPVELALMAVRREGWKPEEVPTEEVPTLNEQLRDAKKEYLNKNVLDMHNPEEIKEYKVVSVYPVEDQINLQLGTEERPGQYTIIPLGEAQGRLRIIRKE